jgi:peptide deformylase
MLLPILHYPDPRLHRKAEPIAEITPEIRQLAADMAETMYQAPGIGLAATQVNVLKRLIVVDVSESRDQLLTLINPEVVAKEGEIVSEEGCLSVPGIYEKVKRSERVTVQAQNLDGEWVTIAADGLLAICLQHEIDHLDGKVFVDYLSPLKQSRIKAKLAKRARITA